MKTIKVEASGGNMNFEKGDTVFTILNSENPALGLPIIYEAKITNSFLGRFGWVLNLETDELSFGMLAEHCFLNLGDLLVTLKNNIIPLKENRHKYAEQLAQKTEKELEIKR